MFLVLGLMLHVQLLYILYSEPNIQIKRTMEEKPLVPTFTATKFSYFTDIFKTKFSSCRQIALTITYLIKASRALSVVRRDKDL